MELEDVAAGAASPAEVRRDSDPMHRMKTIGLIGSISLLTNNITGPGMICEHRVVRNARQLYCSLAVAVMLYA